MWAGQNSDSDDDSFTYELHEQDEYQQFLEYYEKAKGRKLKIEEELKEQE